MLDKAAIGYYHAGMQTKPSSPHQLSYLVGRRLASARGGELSQSALARKAGLSRAAVSAIEAGLQGVTLGTLCRLALILQIEPAFLLPSLSELGDLALAGKAGTPTIVPDNTRSADEIVDEFLKGVEP